jgi:hypothetical protein
VEEHGRIDQGFLGGERSTRSTEEKVNSLVESIS